MFLLGHFVIGLMLGLFLYDSVRDRTVIYATAIGSILPDLIDKPLGHILLVATIDDGRIIAHGLLAVAVLAAAGLLLYRRNRSLLLFCLAGGVLLHQLCDAMWLEPVSWYFPFLGPYVPENHPDYFIRMLFAELGNPTEWLFFVIGAVVIFAIAGKRIIRTLSLRQAALPDPDLLLRRLMILLPLAFAVLGCYSLSCGCAAHYNPVTCWWQPEYNIIFGAVCLGAAAAKGLKFLSAALRPPHFPA